MAIHNRILKILSVFVFMGLGFAAIMFLFIRAFPNAINERFGINESRLLCQDGNEDACKQLANDI